jgi:hypothetical protein
VPRLVRSTSLLLRFVALEKTSFLVGFVAIVTLFVLAVPYEWLESSRLSLYERLGIPSPSIGLTRAYWLLVRGRFDDAWDRNPLIYVTVVILIGIFSRSGLSYLKKKRVSVGFRG